MRIRFALASVLVALTAALAVTAATASAAPTATALTTPVTGTTTGGALSGVATITGFALNSAGQLVANGTLTGTITDAAGNVVTTLTNEVFSTVVTPTASGPGCQVLDLTLGPLNLNLLGLVVTLNQVHLNITAQPGPGNLLGNLLCSVTHLLDGPSGSTAGLQNLLAVLNRLLAGL